MDLAPKSWLSHQAWDQPITVCEILNKLNEAGITPDHIKMIHDNGQVTFYYYSSEAIEFTS